MSKRKAREALAIMRVPAVPRVDIEITRTDRKPKKSFGSLTWTQLKQKPTKQET